MWSTIAGLGIQGGNMLLSYFQNKKAQAASDAHYAQEQARLEAKAKENQLSKASSKASIAEYRREADRQREIAGNKAAIMGSTPESTVATQQALAEGEGRLLAGLAVGADQRAEAYEEQARQSREAQYQQNMQAEAERKQSLINAGTNLAGAVANMADTGAMKSNQQQNNTDTTQNNTSSNAAQTNTGQAAMKAPSMSAQMAAFNNSPARRYAKGLGYLYRQPGVAPKLSV